MAVVPSIVVAVALLLLAVELVGWRATQRARVSQAERGFRARRFRRRVQAAVMLLVVGGLMFVGEMISPEAHPRWYVGVWCAVIVLVVWVVLLALGDALASLQRGQELKRKVVVDRAKMQADAYKRGRGEDASADEEEKR